jgi:hypothetical protein
VTVRRRDMWKLSHIYEVQNMQWSSLLAGLLATAVSGSSIVRVSPPTDGAYAGTMSKSTSFLLCDLSCPLNNRWEGGGRWGGGRLVDGGAE